MASIENIDSIESFQDELTKLDDSGLLAQELVQKGAIHALQHLMLRGCTAEACAHMLQSALYLSEFVTEELNRRQLPTVDTETGEISET